MVTTPPSQLQQPLSQPPKDTPSICNSARITSYYDVGASDIRGKPTSPDKLPHFSRTIKVSWSPPCPMIIQANQNGTPIYTSKSAQSGTVNMELVMVPAGWTEIVIWDPKTGLRVDSVHVVLCDLPADGCRPN
jgi:hypothetical protein